jgi:ParB/RepB/Spo0J family partition protein
MNTVSHAQLVHLDPAAIAIASNVRSDAGYDLDSLSSLADSIATYGVLQPVVVSRKGRGFELVAGHRRVLAAQIAGLPSVPAVVQSTPDDERLARQLAENVHRADLSLLDQAKAVRTLHDEHKSLTLVAEMIGKSKSWTCKMLAITGTDRAAGVALDLLADDVIADLDVAYLVTQIETISGPARADELAAEIREGMHTRDSLRFELNAAKMAADAQARKKIDQAVAAANPHKPITLPTHTVDDLAACLNDAMTLLRNEAECHEDREHAAELIERIEGYACVLTALGY